MAIKTFAAIEQSIIDNILTVNPLIDIKIGEAVRDLFIDPQASQLEQLYATADYSAKAQSVLTAQGNQLDRLGYNYNIIRYPAKRSTVPETLIITNGLSAPTLLNVGDQFYTEVDQNGKIYTFILATTILAPQGTVQLTVPLIALDPGQASDVPAYSIKKSNYEFVNACYNTEAATGGKDIESDAAFASRIPTFVTGTYSNTSYGITKTLFSVANITDVPHIVTPGDPLARGPYAVDVYLQRVSSYFGTPVTEIAPANQQIYTFKQQPLYELNPINQITMFDPTSNTTKTFNPSSFKIINTLLDAINLTTGSVKATSQLQWIGTPPTFPYTVNYNVDQTVIDSQTQFNANSEVVADVLFRQANAVPIFLSADVFSNSNATVQSLQQTTSTNLNNLFSFLKINDTITPNNVVYSLLQDKTINDINIKNLDSTFEIELDGTLVNGKWVFTPTAPSANSLLNHPIRPLQLYWENDPAPGPFSPFSISGRLFIGDPANITPNGYNLKISSNGVTASTTIKNVVASWAPFNNVDPYYDSKTQTLVQDFLVPVTLNADGTNPTIKFNIVQPVVSPINSISYLTLAPSLVQPIIPFAGLTSVKTNYYGTVLPYGLNQNRAKVYKNSVILSVSPDGVHGDYTITGPDSNGVFTINFLVAPSSTDILQFGLLNPDLTYNISTSR